MQGERSQEKITLADLRKLACIAEKDRSDFFTRYPDYKSELLCVALCQGGALHFIDAKNGVKDLDVWSFYKKDKHIKVFPPRRWATADYGLSKFGVHPNDKKDGYVGRRVDIWGRSIGCDYQESPVFAVQNYLAQSRTKSARELRKKAVVLIWPEKWLGKVVWQQIC